MDLSPKNLHSDIGSYASNFHDESYEGRAYANQNSAQEKQPDNFEEFCAELARRYNIFSQSFWQEKLPSMASVLGTGVFGDAFGVLGYGLGRACRFKSVGRGMTSAVADEVGSALVSSLLQGQELDSRVLEDVAQGLLVRGLSSLVMKHCGLS